MDGTVIEQEWHEPVKFDKNNKGIPQEVQMERETKKRTADERHPLEKDTKKQKVE